MVSRQRLPGESGHNSAVPRTPQKPEKDWREEKQEGGQVGDKTPKS